MNDTMKEDCPPGLPRCPYVCGPGPDCSQAPPFSWGLEGSESTTPTPSLSMPTEQANQPSDLCSLRWRTGGPRQGIPPLLLSSLTPEKRSRLYSAGRASQAWPVSYLCLDAACDSFPGPLFPCTGWRMYKNLNSHRLFFASSQSSHFWKS